MKTSSSFLDWPIKKVGFDDKIKISLPAGWLFKEYMARVYGNAVKMIIVDYNGPRDIWPKGRVIKLNQARIRLPRVKIDTGKIA